MIKCRNSGEVVVEYRGKNLHTNHIMMKERNIRYTNVGLQRRGEKENPVRDIGIGVS